MTRPEGREVYFLRQVSEQKYPADFSQNLIVVNNTLKAVSKYLITMQQGIDDLNRDILEQIQDFINEIIIIFTGGGATGGPDSGFEWGQLGYIIDAIGKLFGFDGGPIEGIIDVVEMAAHAVTNFFFPTGLFNWMDDILETIADVFRDFASAVRGTPFVGGALSDILNNIADFVHDTDDKATTAQTAAAAAETKADSAVVTADAANAAVGEVTGIATAAQTAASNAASVAAAAQETADKAYENAQYDITEFAVSTAGVILGTNEEPLGILMTKPTGWNRIITRIIYSMKTNNSTMTVKLMRRALNGTETIVHTTNITSAAITYPDNTIDYQIVDLDHYFCDVTAIGGVANTLHCAMETVLVET